MAEHSSIEWTDATWNPITGCSIVSPGCTHCYAMKLAGTRLRNIPSRKGLTKDSRAGPVWTGEVRFNEGWLTQPLQWRRPRRIFVCAHGDLFAEGVLDEWIDKVFAVMALAPQHTFQVLTKRAERMRAYFEFENRAAHVGNAMHELLTIPSGFKCVHWPLPNVWLGVSAERQKEADERIPDLLATPAAVRFVSLEPLLGPIDLTNHDPSGIQKRMEAHGWSSIWRNNAIGRAWLDWVICGGESGPKARPMHPQWARDIRDQCAEAGVPFFFKQHGEWIGVPDLRNLPGGTGPGFGTYDHCQFDMNADCVRVGKKAAGRLLDGIEHNGMPERL